jgi:phosphoserine aminotransferase
MVNFGAGPARLPQEVTNALHSAFINAEDSGLSILELPHRSVTFKNIIDEANFLTRTLLNIPNNFEIVWMQGGGRLQFATIPMNFLKPNGKAGYLDSGHWAYDALQHAKYYGTAINIGSSRAHNYTFVPEISNVDLARLDYIHLTSNNTIYGTQMHCIPKLPAPVIVDMSSDIFSKPITWENISMAYAVAQKNLGIAGITMIVIDKTFAQHANKNIPPILRYEDYILSNSIINTAPVVAIYTSLCYLRYMNHIGINTVFEQSKIKAHMLYEYISQEPTLTLIPEKDFSNTNICCSFINPKNNEDFITYAQQNKITGIKGHSRLGGLRISLYNGISIDDVQLLISTFRKFISDINMTKN